MRKYNKKYELSSGPYGKELFINGKIINIGAGNADDVYLFYYDKGIVVIMSINNSLSYAGLELLYLEDMEIENKVFLANDWNFEDLNLKKSFFDYSPNRQAEILAQFI